MVEMNTIDFAPAPRPFKRDLGSIILLVLIERVFPIHLGSDLRFPKGRGARSRIGRARVDVIRVYVFIVWFD